MLGTLLEKCSGEMSRPEGHQARHTVMEHDRNAPGLLEWATNQTDGVAFRKRLGGIRQRPCYSAKVMTFIREATLR